MSQPTRVLFLRRGLYDGDRVHGVLQQPANPWFPGIPHSEGVSRSDPEKNGDSYPDQAISVQRSGANAVYSIVETAKENHVNPLAYLTHLFERLPNVD